MTGCQEPEVNGQAVLLADARFVRFSTQPASVHRSAPPRFMLGGPAQQVSGCAAWLAQLPSGAIVGINEYRLTGGTAELADLWHHRGYMHGRWTRGTARFGTREEQGALVGGDVGDWHYAVVQQASAPLLRRTALGCRGVFTTPTAAGGGGPAGSIAGTLDMVWQGGALSLVGCLDIQANGARARLPIRQFQPAIGATCHGGSLFGGSTYDLTPAVAENGMLRCVILYRAYLDSGVPYQGVAMFQAHTHSGTQNMYTKNGQNC